MLTKEIELYLQLCTQQNMHHKHIRQALPGEISWFIKVFNWDLATMLFQTVTLKKDILILEVWDSSCDDGIAKFSEIVDSDISLEILHVKLRDAAKIATIKLFEDFSIDSYQEELDHLIERYGNPQSPYTIYRVNQIKNNLEQLSEFCRGCRITEIAVQEIEEEIDNAIGALRDRFPRTRENA